jgi:glycosyltransferase involved in cell wall biosynthesis
MQGQERNVFLTPAPARSSAREPLAASVVVCTHNRGSLLGESIEALLAQKFPEEDFEILVVDNASTDSTPSVLEELVRRHPRRVRAVREPILGHSSSRNRGVLASRGRVVAYTDDDARASPGWLAALVEACSRPDVWCAGGPVRPLVKGTFPEWLTPAFYPYLALFDKGDAEVDLAYNEYPRGVNIAFPREAFRAVGLFSTAFGRRGKRSLLSYDEIELSYRIASLGKRILYIPAAEAFHLIDAERLTPNWFLRRFYWQGKSEVYFDLVHRGVRFVKENLRQERRLRKAARALMPAGRDDKDLYARCRRRAWMGYAVGAFQGWVTRIETRARPAPYGAPVSVSR